MNVLVTGASGFVGQHLVPLLLAQGHAVTALARSKARAKDLSWYPEVNFLTHDILDSSACIDPGWGSFDAIIHLAWSDLANYKSLSHFELILPAHYRFLKAIVEAGVGRVLITGSCLEYGLQSGRLSEGSYAIPTTPYGLAKDTLRKFLVCLSGDRPFDLQWVRLFYLFGVGQNRSSLLAQLHEAIKCGQKVFNMTQGDQLRDYLPVRDAARKIVALFECKNATGIFNVCRGTPISVRSLVEQKVKELNADIALNLGFFKYADYEPMAFWGDDAKFRSVVEGLESEPSFPK